MTQKQKAARGNQRVPFDMASCTAMLEEMMDQYGAVCDCAGMVGQGGYAETVFQMMASCCGVQGETQETTPTQPNQEA